MVKSICKKVFRVKGIRRSFKKMYCTECGTKIIEGAKFCFECGKPVSAIEAEIRAAEEAKKAAEESMDIALKSAEAHAAAVIGESVSSDAPVSPETTPASEETEVDGETIKAEPKTAENAGFSGSDAVSVQAGQALGSEGLGTGQLLTMILAGASFLFVMISVSNANWLHRLIVLIACACLTFIAARKHELPRQTTALPLAVFTAACLGDRITAMIKRLLAHMNAGLSIEGIAYRCALIAVLILIIAITFNGFRKKKAPAAVLALLCALFSVYHIYFFAASFKLGRAPVMYNLGMCAFFAAYITMIWRYIKERAAQDEYASSHPVFSQVHVESKADTAPEEASEGADPYPASGTETLFCSRCGAKLAIDSSFCNKCGYPIR